MPDHHCLNKKMSGCSLPSSPEWCSDICYGGQSALTSREIVGCPWRAVFWHMSSQLARSGRSESGWVVVHPRYKWCISDLRWTADIFRGCFPCGRSILVAFGRSLLITSHLFSQDALILNMCGIGRSNTVVPSGPWCIWGSESWCDEQNETMPTSSALDRSCWEKHWVAWSDPKQPLQSLLIKNLHLSIIDNSLI